MKFFWFISLMGLNLTYAADPPEKPTIAIAAQAGVLSGNIEADFFQGLELRLTNHENESSPFFSIDWQHFRLDEAVLGQELRANSFALIVGRQFADLESFQFNLGLGGMWVRRELPVVANLPSSAGEQQTNQNHLGLVVQTGLHHYLGSHFRLSLQGQYFVSYEDKDNYGTAPASDGPLHFGSLEGGFSFVF